MGVKGGKLLAAYVKKVRAANQVKKVEVGFYKTARYPDGTPVTNVAAWNQFGTRRKGKVHSPARPFFTNALTKARPEVRATIRSLIDPQTLGFTVPLAQVVGNQIKGKIQEEIRVLKQPPNAPATVAAKRAKTKGARKKKPDAAVANPLIDTGKLRRSTTYKVIRK